MKILITGGCGYIGSVLTEELIKNNHYVTIVDTLWFGNNLKKKKNLKIIKKDFRKLSVSELKKHKIVIHLANVANDPGAILNPLLSWNINTLGTKIIIEKCIKAKIQHFIFASSGSVYGVSKKRRVTENTDLLPISTYNETKMIAEQILFNYFNKIKIQIIRPATVCGFSKRLRLDVAVNLLTNQAIKKREMTILGGKQVRPNIHIKDFVRVIIHFIKKKSINSGVYNAGFENLSIVEIAKKIQKLIKSKIKFKKSNDKRSYRLDSTKLLNSGFRPKFNVNYAIKEIIENKNLYKETINNYNVKKMKKLNLKSD